jgi:hypothetical protein
MVSNRPRQALAGLVIMLSLRSTCVRCGLLPHFALDCCVDQMSCGRNLVVFTVGASCSVVHRTETAITGELADQMPWGMGTSSG